jgi:hypothetical protein
MTIDDMVGRALTDLTEDLTPLPDPYGRARTRFHRSRRRRRTALGASLVAAVLAAGAVLVPSRDGGPPVAASPSIPAALLGWAERLADSPTRGAVGADQAFVADFAGKLAARQRAGDYRVKVPVRQVKVLFADDIGTRRIAFVAFALAQPDPITEWPNASAWFVAPRGATADALAAPSAVQSIGDGLEPFVVTNIADHVTDEVTVALAPSGCEFASAPLPEATAWAPEPTGSYIVRTHQTRRAEWWQITCDGVVKWEQPARTIPDGVLTDADLARATERVRGTFDRQLSQQAPSTLTATFGYAIRDLPRVAWNGRITGAEPDINGEFDGKAVVVAAPAVRGGWVGEVDIVYDAVSARGSQGTSQPFSTDTDPTDPSSVVAIRLGQNTSTVLVITPVGATTVRAVRANGEIVAQTAVRDAGAVIKVTDPATVTFQALDRQGTVLSRGKVAGQGSTGDIDHWDEP